MTNPLQKQTNDAMQMIADDMQKCQAKVFDGLVATLQVRTLPEHVFRDYFLKGFLGESPSPRWVAEWIGVAGTPNSEVAIMDTNTGTELFRVPPMISSGSIMTGSAFGAHRLGAVFEHMSNLRHNSPHQAVQFMQGALGAKAQEIGHQDLTSHNQRWIAIFARYGYVPAAPEQSANPTANQGDSFFDYD